MPPLTKSIADPDYACVGWSARDDDQTVQSLKSFVLCAPEYTQSVELDSVSSSFVGSPEAHLGLATSIRGFQGRDDCYRIDTPDLSGTGSSPALDEIEAGSPIYNAAETRLTQAFHDTQPRLIVFPYTKSRSEIVAEFNQLADNWERETAFISMVPRKLMHPSYQRIISLGKPVVKLILERLRQEPRQWFWALTMITNEDPAEGLDRADAAADAWIQWGLERGLLSE